MLDLDQLRRELEAPDTTPLYLRLRNAIRDRIHEGVVTAGTPLPAERLLQEQLGVSRSTVRHAIKALTEDGLLRSMVGSGNYIQAPAGARHVAQASPVQNNLVGVVVDNEKFYAYYARLASTLNNTLREAGYRVDMSLHDDRVENLSHIVDGLLAQNVAAVAMSAPSHEGVEPIVQWLLARGVRVVMVARYVDVAGIDYVAADNERIGYEATRHLIELGHTGILHFASLNPSTGISRAIGYLRAMREAGLIPRLYPIYEYERSLVPADLLFHVEPELNPALVWTAIARRSITALFSFNDYTSLWVQRELQKMGLLIPRHVSLISVDNLPYSEFFEAPLSSFELPGEAIGRQAATLIMQRLQGDTSPPQHVLLPARLIQRLSTSLPTYGSLVEPLAT